MTPDADTAAAHGFAAISAADARILILGSLPGVRSIADQRYYAHPRNAFWPIMRDVFGIDGDYETRCRELSARGIALWDVLECSVRPGSLDADIDLKTARANDFQTFFRTHPHIARVCLNGGKAAQMFRRFVVGRIDAAVPDCTVMPSTSPAYASMSFEEKRERWRVGLELDADPVSAGNTVFGQSS